MVRGDSTIASVCGEASCKACMSATRSIAHTATKAPKAEVIAYVVTTCTDGPFCCKITAQGFAHFCTFQFLTQYHGWAAVLETIFEELVFTTTRLSGMPGGLAGGAGAVGVVAVRPGKTKQALMLTTMQVARKRT